VAIAKSGRTKNKKVKTVVTRANIFAEAFKYFRSLVKLFCWGIALECGSLLK